MGIPTIALFSGDPAGIGPELVEKLLADPPVLQRARVILIAQDDAMRVPGNVLRHDWSGRRDPEFAKGVAAEANGSFMLAGLAEGLKLVRQGRADAFCFAPLNKSALRLGGMHHEDELRWFVEALEFKGVCGELNVLERLWTSRVTSHVALRDVSALLTPEGVADAIMLVTRSLRAAGNASPRIAVCGLNPHNGDNGNYGDEEARIIEPGIALALGRGCPADGPFPADTAFVRARKEVDGYDGIVTMYHDQGQIAMKLMGFERGVTVHGGLPIPITTPAHGTAYDIAGRGLASAIAMGNAFDIACRMGRSFRAARVA